MDNQQEKEVELTAEELDQKKEDMLKFYTDSLPYLEAQSKYEKLLAEIDEYRFKRTSIQIQYAMMMQESQRAQETETEERYQTEEEPTKRTLKKD
jgi:hypothetical protein